MDSEGNIIRKTRVDRRAVKLDPSAHKKLESMLNQLTYLYNRAREERIRSYDKYEKLIKWGLSEKRFKTYFYPHWKSGISYNKGNKVKHIDKVYIALNRVRSEVRPCNDLLNWRELSEEEIGKKSISYEDQARSLTEIRNDLLLSDEFSKVDAQAQQRTLQRLDKAYKEYMKGIRGRPRYKNSSRKIKSFETYQWSRVKKQDRRTTLSVKGAGRMSFKGRIPEGTKYIRIVRTALRVEIQFVYETVVGVDRGSDRPIGIDLGVKNRITLSDGTFCKGTEIDRKELKRKQRAISRAEKGSNNRNKKKTAYAKERARTTEREHNKIHELTTGIVKGHGNHFIVEDLKLKNMTKSAKGTVEDPGKKVKQKSGLNRSIQEQQLGKVISQLTYKVESTGGKIIRVPSQYTSQTCSACGYVAKNNRKGELFKCMSCGYKVHADLNAANNVLKRGLFFLSGGNKDESLPMQAGNMISKENGVRGTLLAEQYI